MASFLPAPASADEVTIKSVDGVFSVKSGGVITGAPVHDSGSQTTGNGADIASITAASGKRLVGGSYGAVHCPAGTSLATVTLTLADDTTVSATAPAAGLFVITADGIQGAAALVSYSGAVAQAVKGVAAVTSGAGGGTRTATLCAAEVLA